MSAEGIELPSWDAVAEIAQSVRVPAAFRPKRLRGRAPAGHIPRQTIAWAAFDVLSDCTDCPGHLLAVGVDDVMLHGDSVAPGSPNGLIGGRSALRSCGSHVCSGTEPDPWAEATGEGDRR